MRLPPLLWLWITAVVLAACRAPQVRPSPVPLEQRVAGCYALQSGPWQIDARFTEQSVPLRLPRQIQLHATPVTRRPSPQQDSLPPFFGARSHAAPEEGVYWFGYWRQSPADSDTLRISGDSRAFSIVDLRLRPEEPDLIGEVRVTLGFPGETDPRIATASVMARRVPCPEP